MRHLRNLTVAIIALISFSAISLQLDVLAQEVLSTRPAAEVMNWGRDRLPYPEWLVGVQEEGFGRAQGIWKRLDAVVDYRMNTRFPDQSTTAINKLVDETWLQATFGTYDSWQEVDRCVVGNVRQEYLIVDLKLTFQGEDYQARYWLWGDHEAFRETILSFKTDVLEQFEALSDLFFPKFAGCPNQD